MLSITFTVISHPRRVSNVRTARICILLMWCKMVNNHGCHWIISKNMFLSNFLQEFNVLLKSIALCDLHLTPWHLDFAFATYLLAAQTPQSCAVLFVSARGWNIYSPLNKQAWWYSVTTPGCQCQTVSPAQGRHCSLMTPPRQSSCVRLMVAETNWFNGCQSPGISQIEDPPAESSLDGRTQQITLGTDSTPLLNWMHSELWWINSIKKNKKHWSCFVTATKLDTRQHATKKIERHNHQKPQ